MSVVARPLGDSNAVLRRCRGCIFTKCRETQPGALRALFVKGSPTAEVPVAFHDADGEVRFPQVYIGWGGSLRAALQNRWDDGRGGGGYYSLLHHTERLEIENNPRAIRALLAYVQGTYKLGEHWEQKELSRDMAIEISLMEVEPQSVQTLRAHFAAVVLRNVQVGDIVWSCLREQDNSVRGDRQNVFTGCRDVPLEKLKTLYACGSPAADVPIEFLDADSEVHFPEINI